MGQGLTLSERVSANGPAGDRGDAALLILLNAKPVQLLDRTVESLSSEGGGQWAGNGRSSSVAEKGARRSAVPRRTARRNRGGLVASTSPSQRGEGELPKLEARLTREHGGGGPIRPSDGQERDQPAPRQLACSVFSSMIMHAGPLLGGVGRGGIAETTHRRLLLRPVAAPNIFL